MSDVHEHMEHMEHAEHAAHSNRKIALLIAVLALFLALSETLGKSAQVEAIHADVEGSNVWAFFQAKTIRMALMRTAAEELTLEAASVADSTVKTAMDKQIEAWKKNVARYESEPETNEGRKELAEKARHLEEERNLYLAKYHHYEIASAAFQIGIVLCSAAVITGMVALVWFAGVLGAGGLAVMLLGVLAPHIVPLP